MNMIESGIRENAGVSAVTQTSANSRSMGAILIEAKRLSVEGAEQILRLQKSKGTRFGEAAIELNLLNPDDIQFALARQFESTYLPAGDASMSPELLAAYAPSSPVVEQLRALRGQLKLRWFDDDTRRKTLAIVSPGQGEGRSFMTANLAIVFSQLGKRTLLIDGNLRSPRQHQLFRLGSSAGFSELLAGRARFDSVVKPTSLPGLSVLPGGVVPPDPQELLARPAFPEILKALSCEYSVIFIDTPAAGDYADAQTIAVGAGSALILARNHQSSLAELVDLASGLQQSGATLVGSVLNDIQRTGKMKRQSR